MGEITRLYLDTNIFIALKETGGEIGDLLVELLACVPVGNEPFLATSELTLAELLAKPYAEARDDLIEQYDNWISLSSWLAVGPVSRDALWYAAVIRSQYKSVKLPDAIHISTAFGFRCSHILTNDAGIKGTYELYHQRYGVRRGPIRTEVIRPTPESLRNIIRHVTEQ